MIFLVLPSLYVAVNTNPVVSNVSPPLYVNLLGFVFIAILVNFTSFCFQLAVYTKSPVVPLLIVTDLLAVVPLLPVHPKNVYPLLVGFFNVYGSAELEYDVLLVAEPPIKL